VIHRTEILDAYKNMPIEKKHALRERARMNTYYEKHGNLEGFIPKPIPSEI